MATNRDEALIRCQLLFETTGLNQLENCSVLVVGIGGVGSYCAEALARSGVGKLYLLDYDTIAVSNMNRQLPATVQTIGMVKVEAMKQRLAQSAPWCEVKTLNEKFEAATTDKLLTLSIDYVVDAIDTITHKATLIKMCQDHNIPIISSLGMGNRLDSSQIVETTLDKTTYDPLAKALRRKLKELGGSLKTPVVFSKERPITQRQIVESNGVTRKQQMPPASSPFVPPAAGLLCASIVVRTLLGKKA